MRPILPSIWCISVCVEVVRQRGWRDPCSWACSVSLSSVGYISVSACICILYVLSSYYDVILRQKQMALKKRQWHVAHLSQQPDWGRQLCVSWEHVGFTGLGATLEGGGMLFGATGTTFGFWKVEEKEGGTASQWGSIKIMYTVILP